METTVTSARVTKPPTAIRLCMSGQVSVRSLLSVWCSHWIRLSGWGGKKNPNKTGFSGGLVPLWATKLVSSWEEPASVLGHNPELWGAEHERDTEERRSDTLFIFIMSVTFIQHVLFVERGPLVAASIVTTALLRPLFVFFSEQQLSRLAACSNAVVVTLWDWSAGHCAQEQLQQNASSHFRLQMLLTSAEFSLT